MIKYIDKIKTFVLDGEDFSYVFKLNAYGAPQSLHYGKKVGADDLSYLYPPIERGFSPSYPGERCSPISPDTTPCEFPAYGGGDFRISAVLTSDANGNRVEHLKFKSYNISKEKPPIVGMPSLRGGETLTLTLASANLEVTLYYSVYADLGAIARRAEVKNISGGDIRIERLASMSLDLPGMDYDLIALRGKHCGERRLERAPLRRGITSLSSVRGASSHQMNPFLALCARNADESTGEAYGFNLIYGGSYLMQAECGQTDTVRVFSGFPETDFSWTLAAGETLAAPETALVHSNNGLGEMSRRFHTLYRRYLINPRFVNAPRPIVINNWEATYFTFDNDRLCALIDSCKGLGIDTFVLDDGWFGSRDGDASGLGDWYVNTKKLAGGLSTIINRCKENGMKFGLWFEPEMISEDSDLYRAHPDWAIRIPWLPSSYGRKQMVLDLSRGEVLEHIKSVVSDILKNNDISYVKWDFNRHITDAYSVNLPASRQQEIWHRYMLGFYSLAEYLTSSFPDILFEGCSGGGGRFDPSMLRYFPQIWTSDNSDAFERGRIQYGTSLVYPLSAMTGHVSVCPNHQTGRVTPFSTRGIIACNCRFGYELNVDALSDAERAEIKLQTANYRAIEPLIADGELYRLKSPFDGADFAFLIVAKDADTAVLSYMRGLAECNQPQEYLKLIGLDKDKTYRIRELNLTLSGQTLQSCGIPLPVLSGDFQAVMYHLQAVKK
ncbi:MAG: alpha-galactosidase [Clostridiales bacterium]|jgi:alpha-galactosidase|nr:alpha-galactosidase [Clostridiales bacterium]